MPTGSPQSSNLPGTACAHFHASSRPASSFVAGLPGHARRPARGQAAVWVIVLVLVAAGGFWWWKSHGSAEGSAASASAAGANASAPGGKPGGRRGGGSGVQAVSVQAVRRQDIRVSVNAIGAISAARTVIVRPQVAGVLQSLKFTEGEQVKAGQVLAQIDPRAFEASVAQSEGALARDRAQLENARLDLARYRDLLAKDALPKQQFDTQRAQVAQLEGTVKVDEAAVASARLQLSYTRVTAPISGRAGFNQLDVGNMAQPSDTAGIVQIAQTRPASLVFSIPSAHVPLLVARLHAKQPMTVRALDRGGKRELAVGTVATIDNAIDPATDTIKVKAEFPNQDDALFPNQAVSVNLQLDTVTNALAVPQAAVLRGAQGFYVYVVNADSTVTTRVVQPGPVDGDWMALEGELQAGEKVVVDGVDRLRDGAKVEVIANDGKGKGPRGGERPPGGKRGNRGQGKGAPDAMPAQGAAAPTPAGASASGADAGKPGNTSAAAGNEGGRHAGGNPKNPNNADSPSGGDAAGSATGADAASGARQHRRHGGQAGSAGDNAGGSVSASAAASGSAASGAAVKSTAPKAP